MLPKSFPLLALALLLTSTLRQSQPSSIPHVVAVPEKYRARAAVSEGHPHLTQTSQRAILAHGWKEGQSWASVWAGGGTRTVATLPSLSPPAEEKERGSLALFARSLPASSMVPVGCLQLRGGRKMRPKAASEVRFRLNALGREGERESEIGRVSEQAST